MVSFEKVSRIAVVMTVIGMMGAGQPLAQAQETRRADCPEALLHAAQQPATSPRIPSPASAAAAATRPSATAPSLRAPGRR